MGVFPGNLSVPLANPCIIGLLGHSMTAAASGAFASPRGMVTMGPQHTFGWASLMSGGRYTLDEYSCTGISGSTSGHILTRAESALGGRTQLQAVALGRAGTVILNTGVNDTSTLASLNSTTIPNFRAIIRAVLAMGKQIVVMTPSAKGSAAFTGHRTTGEVTPFLFGLRNWIMTEMPREFPRGVIPFDAFAATADLASVNGYGDVKTGYTYDGLHMTGYGNLMLDRAMVAALAPILGGVPVPNVGVDAAYAFDAALAPRGNLLTNGPLVTGGTTALSGTTGGVTLAGVRPNSWTLSPNGVLTGGATMTITGSIETTATGWWFKLAFNGTINAGGAQDYAVCELVNPLNLVTSPVNVGDLLRMTGECEIVAGSVGITNVQLGFVLTGGGGGSMYQGYIEQSIDKAGLDAGVASADLPITYPGGLSVPVTGSAPTGASARILVGFASNASAAITVNGAVRFRNVKVWKAAG